MQTICVVVWGVCAVIVLWAMIGYPVFLIIIDKIKNVPDLRKDFSNVPTVTIIVVAHN